MLGRCSVATAAVVVALFTVTARAQQQQAASGGSSGNSSLPGGGTKTGGIGPVCDEENWPDKDGNLVCGDCKVLVNTFDSYYKTCNGYCQSMGMACAGAWEESNDECTIMYNMTCDQAIQSSDALCECKKGTGVIVKPPCPGDIDAYKYSGGRVHSCAANASLCKDDAPLVAMGASKGWFQKSCCATCSGSSGSSSGSNSSSGSGLKTCLDVKKEYQKQNCCGMPTKAFDWTVSGSKQRRLSKGDLVDAVLATLEEAKMQGGAEHAASMATQLIDMVQKFAEDEA